MPLDVSLFLEKINIICRLLNPPASTSVQMAVHDNSINITEFVKLLPEEDQININALLPPEQEQEQEPAPAEQ